MPIDGFMEPTRTPPAVTFSVWKALFLREALSRISRQRAAWLWLLVEPLFHIVVLITIFTFIRVRVVGGIATALWIMVGILAFFMFMRPFQQAGNAIDVNRALFGYRQVKPVDAVLVRAGLEGFLTIMIAVILFTGAGLSGLDIVPADPLMVLAAFFGMWLLGLGCGLIVSVATELVPEIGNVMSLAVRPLYFVSGVIFPLANVPSPYREWVLLNPLAHGLEAARLGFAPYYQAVPELDMGYMYGCALALIFLGLALHNRYAMRLALR